MTAPARVSDFEIDRSSLTIPYDDPVLSPPSNHPQEPESEPSGLSALMAYSTLKVVVNPEAESSRLKFTTEAEPSTLKEYSSLKLVTYNPEAEPSQALEGTVQHPLKLVPVQKRLSSKSRSSLSPMARSSLDHMDHSGWGLSRSPFEWGFSRGPLVAVNRSSRSSLNPCPMDQSSLDYSGWGLSRSPLVAVNRSSSLRGLSLSQAFPSPTEWTQPGSQDKENLSPILRLSQKRSVAAP